MHEFSNTSLTLCALAASALAVLGISYIYARRDRRKYVQVGFVSKLFIHPIKSCRGLEVSQVECGTLGVSSDGVLDRSFLIINAEGRFMTQRQDPSIALITPSFSKDKKCLLVNAPGMPTLTLLLEDPQRRPIHKLKLWRLMVEGEECDPSAGEWLSQYLGSPGCKLIRHTQRMQGKLIKDDHRWGIIAKRWERSAFQDLGHVNILSSTSLDDLNSKLDKPVQSRNFRPNILFEGAPAFHEDNWRYVRIGNDTSLRKTHACYRCRQTTVDPDTGKFSENGDPLTTLKTYRMPSADDPLLHRYGTAPLFGINLAIENRGCIKLGDPIYASMV